MRRRLIKEQYPGLSNKYASKADGLLLASRISGGQKQAIGLARVLIRQPKVLFLDEPTAHFDVRSEADFIERLKVLAARVLPSSCRHTACRC